MPLEGGLTVSVTADAVGFAFSVANTGSEPVELEFRSGKTADVVVYADEAEVWRWSEGRMFTQAIRTETVQPGDAWRTEMTWTDPGPGEYTAEASLAATGAQAVDRVAFQVP